MSDGPDAEDADRDGDPRPADDTEPADDPEPADDHLAGVPAGAGCTDIWEHLSERRRSDDDD